MSKGIAMMVGAVLFGHGVIGLFIEGRHFLLFNVDFALDLLYLALGAMLLFVSRERAGGPLVRLGLLAAGVVLVGVGLLGLVDHRLFGFAPLGLLPLDHLLFYGLGGACLIGAILPRAEVPIWDVERDGTPVQS